ncbi:nitrogen permease regulator 3, partial [Phenoliferia sp. Uapishka_3]
MASLLAVILVASSSRGHSLVYSYPPEPQAVKRTLKPTYPSYRQSTYAYQAGNSSASGDSSDDDDDDVDEANDEDAASRLAAEHKRVKSYLGFPDSVLAGLLCPNRELCDQPFELVVDHLAFVGHPVWLGDDEPMQRKDAEEAEAEERGRSRRRRESRAAAENGRKSPVGGSPTGQDEKTFDRDPTVVPSATSPHVHTGASSSLSSHNNSYGTPTSLGPYGDSAMSVASSQQSQTSINGDGRITSFNFVCVIDTPPDSHLSSHLEGYYRDVIVPMTANLKALEKREKWLGKEAARLRKAREEYFDKGRSATDYLASLPTLSPLADAISRLFTTLKSSQIANIQLSTLQVQLLLRGELPIEEDDASTLIPADESLVASDVQKSDSSAPETRAPSEVRERSASPAEELQRQRPPLFSRMRKRPPVRFHPWDTLLLLEDAEELQRNVLEETLLWRFLEICDPTLSFAEYEALLDIDPEEASMQEIVDHFVHWKKARVIDVVSLKSAYAISASFSPASIADLSSPFRRDYPILPPLPTFLSQISPTDSFSSLVTMASLRSTYLLALSWLLRHEILEKQHSYIRIFVSEEIKRSASMHWSLSGASTSAASASGTDGPRRREREHSGLVRESQLDAHFESMKLHGESPAQVFGIGGSGGGSGGSGALRIKGGAGRFDLEDARAMSIVGSALSNSPPLSRSAQSNRSARRRTLTAGRGRTLSSNTFSSNGSERQEETFKGATIILEPGRPTAIESKWLSEICREKEKSVVDKFEKMVRMLNGAHHVDEIRYRTNLSRKDVKTVLAAFSDHLIVFTHSRA